MKHVTACYIDAADGRPATEAPLRHGPQLPHPELVVDAVDRRHSPALIIGRMPVDTPITAAMELVSAERHAELLADYQLWRDGLAMAQREQETERTEQARRDAYRQRVDPLINESILKRAMGHTADADELLAEAIAQREAVQAELPWPA